MLTASEAPEILLSRRRWKQEAPSVEVSRKQIRSACDQLRATAEDVLSDRSMGLTSPTQAGLTYGAAFIEAGALAVRGGGVAPEPFALALVSPAVPWGLWLFPASIPEAGVLRALLWPGLVLLMGGLTWLGGRLGPHFTSRRPDGI